MALRGIALQRSDSGIGFNNLLPVSVNVEQLRSSFFALRILVTEHLRLLRRGILSLRNSRLIERIHQGIQPTRSAEEKPDRFPTQFRPKPGPMRDQGFRDSWAIDRFKRSQCRSLDFTGKLGTQKITESRNIRLRLRDTPSQEPQFGERSRKLCWSRYCVSRLGKEWFELINRILYFATAPVAKLRQILTTALERVQQAGQRGELPCCVISVSRLGDLRKHTWENALVLRFRREREQ